MALTSNGGLGDWAQSAAAQKHRGSGSLVTRVDSSLLNLTCLAGGVVRKSWPDVILRTVAHMASIMIRKPLNLILEEAGEEGECTLKRALGVVNLVTLGIGAIIGAGIFVLTGSAAAQYAGPAIILSFLLAGLGCVFAGLCYAEFASLIPIAGSANTYGYATLGELFAWIIGWDLILEYAFGAATVASGWSGYLLSFLQDFGIVIPPQFTSARGEPLVQYNGHWGPA